MDFCKLTTLRCACECFFFSFAVVFSADKELNDSICLELENKSILWDSYVTTDPNKNDNSMG